jgi:hypothetical protein
MSEDDETVEVVGGDRVEEAKSSWQQEVWDRTNGNCGNCGSDHKVRVKLMVPEIAGGKKAASNASIICRACEMAMDSSEPKTKHSNNRPINFWVSRRLFERMNNGLCSDRGFKSKSALIRYLMNKYITAETQFDDLDRFQDAEGIDTAKVNAWVPRETYATFQAMIGKRGMTVTDAIKSLVMVYEDETTKE